ISARTDGEGVDVILNSLVGEAVSKNLSILRASGRYLELSTRNIVQNPPIGLFALHNNLSFSAINIDRLIREHPAVVGAILHELAAGIEAGTLRALPVTVFPLSEVVNAFGHMARAKHIGKIAVTLQDESGEVVSSGAEPGRFEAEATYLITGGLGGLGLTVAQWMVDEGARAVVLTGRSAASPAAQGAIERMRQIGARVVVANADVAREQDVRRLLAMIAESLPPLRGIIHAAGVLDDGIALQLDLQRLKTVMAPKVQGAWNLHTLTAHLPLEFFILFSSAASLLGSPGQANYAAANAFLDALAHHRRAHGLPALAINWGPWAEVGLAARSDRGGRLASRGIASFTPQQGLAALSLLWRDTRPQVGVMPFDLRQWSYYYPVAQTSPLLAVLASEQTVAPTRPGDLRGQSLAIRDTVLAASVDEQPTLLETYVSEQLAQVLGLTRAKVDIHRPMNTLGLDSLMAVELKNRLERDLGIPISVMELLQGPSVDQLATQVLERLAAVLPALPSVAAAPPGERTASAPLSYGQRALWFLHQLAPESAAYNVAFAARIGPGLDVPALRQTFQALVDRHAMLRTTFRAADGEPVQELHAQISVAFQEEDATAWSERTLQERLVEEAHRPFDLERGPLLRVFVFARPVGEYVLSLTAHHIVVDFWSMV
ncbi:MAG TPA: SDR family NAD(P)-dependent oxidoreductase, partial [Ktedonobacterales bacterium]